MLRSILYAVAFYGATLVFMVLGFWLLVCPRSWAMMALKLHGLCCIWLLKVICGTDLEVRGREKVPRGACLVVAKHQSAWDTFALLTLFQDPAVVLKDELTWIPLYGWFIVKFQHIRVKRERAALALKRMVRDAEVCVRQGRQVLIFPEGTRTAPGATPDYKPGYLALYEALGVPCVPVALNSGLFWPRRTLMRYPGTIVVEFLDPLPPGLKRRDYRQGVERAIETATNELIDEALGAAPVTTHTEMRT
jgi:1-acyl-sn-glycerol-3-phosphate acyltransferase